MEYWVVTENDTSVYHGEQDISVERYFGSVGEAEDAIEEWTKENEGSGAKQLHTIVCVEKVISVTE